MKIGRREKWLIFMKGDIKGDKELLRRGIITPVSLFSVRITKK